VLGDQQLNESALPTPNQIGKYKIIDTVGTGGMGTVYRAFDPTLERVVALKILHLDRLDDVSSEELKSRFVNEARTVARLNHPGIVAVYEFAQESPLAYISMEYVDGWTLDNYVKQRSGLDVCDAVTILTQILDALSYAHRQDVVHRDIKPANLLVSSEGNTKITDFGIAKIGARNRTQTGILVGTMQYMAPEQFLGGPVDHRCDIHAAGIVLYELLTGVSPFAHGGGFAMHKVCHEDPAPPSSLKPELPKSFDSVVARALAKRPNDRYTTAKDFKNAIWAAYHSFSGREPDTALSPRPPATDTTAKSVRPRTGAVPLDPAEPGSAGAVERAAHPASVPPAPPVQAVQQTVLPESDPAAHVARGAPAPATGMAWTSGQLTDLERRLVPLVGPLAKVLVRKAAANTRERHELITALANSLQPKERERFIKDTGPTWGFPAADPVDRGITGNTSPGHAASAGVQPAAAAPLTEERVRVATRILAQYLGPIATVLCRKAAQRARDDGEFLELLAANLTSETERRAFMRAMAGHRN
jgi:serine/threonine protein kinase